MSKKKRSPGFEKKREEETRDDTAELATKEKKSPGFSEKIEWWHPQLPPRVTVSPTLVTPLRALLTIFPVSVWLTKISWKRTC